MSIDTDSAMTRRSVIRGSGALAVGLGAAGTASAHPHCDPCDEDPDRFCAMRCVVTSVQARAYNRCPYDALSHVAYVPEGTGGFVMQECSDGCYHSYLVDFCGEQWWIRGSELDEGSLDDCVC